MSTLVCDFVDDTSFTRKSQLLHQLYIRGRHYMISTITATQVYKAVGPVIHKKYDTSVYLHIKKIC